MHDGFIHQDTNTKVSMIFNNSRAYSSEEEAPNIINTFIFSGGRYEYIVQYANPVGTLQSRGNKTLADAVADAKSGERSTSTTFKIDSYWGGDDASSYETDVGFKGGSMTENTKELPDVTLTGCKNGSVKATYENGGTQTASYDFFMGGHLSSYTIIDNTEECADETDDGTDDETDDGTTGDIEALSGQIEPIEPEIPMAVKIGIPVVIIGAVVYMMR